MKIRLSVRAGAAATEHEFAGPRVTIGRNRASHVVLEADSPTSVVSYDHARIDVGAGGATTLTDLDSRNGTYRGAERVRGCIPFRPGDAVRFGITGPELTLLNVDARLEVPPAAAVPDDDFLPVALPPPKPVKRPAKPAEPSGTRMLLMEALESHQEKDSRLRRRLIGSGSVVAGILLIVFLLLWKFGDTQRGLVQTVDGHTRSIKQMEEDNRVINEFVTLLDINTTKRFGAIDQQLAETAVAEAVRREKEQTTEVRFKSLEERNRAIEESVREAAKKAPAAATPAGEAAAAGVTAPTPAYTAPAVGAKILRGQQIKIYHANGTIIDPLYVVDMSSEILRGYTIDKGKPRDYIWKRDIQAVETDEGIFVVDDFGGLVDAFTFFELEPGGGTFRKMANKPKMSACQEGTLDDRAGGFVRVQVTKAGGGLCLGIPDGRQFDSLPASEINRIETKDFVYTYNSSTRRYDARSQRQLSDDRQAKRDDKFHKEEAEKYRKKMEQYEAATRRLRAIRWWW